MFWRAIKERLNPLVVLDAGALFAAFALPFGRIGNLINGDIIGYPSRLLWSTVYDNAASWACQNPGAGTCHVPVQPAAGYELLLNLVLIALLLVVARRARRPGMLLVTYLFGYAVTQFLVFFRSRQSCRVPGSPGLRPQASAVDLAHRLADLDPTDALDQALARGLGGPGCVRPRTRWDSAKE